MLAEAVDAIKALDLHIVGLCGVSGAGKDTVYEHILQTLGFIRIGFAFPFKMELVATGEATFDEVFSTKPPHVRDRLQRIGEEHRQLIDADIWCDYFLTWVRTMHQLMGLRVDKLAVIDVRHPNEIACLKAIGGKILHLDPPTKSLVGTQAPHISETACPAALPSEDVVSCPRGQFIHSDKLCLSERFPRFPRHISGQA